jgi:hypothetical protein
MSDHLDDLGRALRSPDAGAARSRNFVGDFIRPRGLDVPATDVFVATVESLSASPARQTVRDASIVTPLFRRVLLMLERRAQHGRVKEWMMSPTEYDLACKRRDRVAADRARTEASIRERLARKAAHQQRKRELKQARRARPPRRSTTRLMSAATSWLRHWQR